MKRNSELSKTIAGVDLFHHNFPHRKEPAHAHEEHQFFIPLEGRFLIEIPDSTHPRQCILTTGDLLFLPAHSLHSFTSMDGQSGEQLLGLISASCWENSATIQPSFCIARAPQLLKELIWFLLARPVASGDDVFAQALVQIIAQALTAAQGPTDSDFALLTTRVTDSRLKEVLSDLQQNFSEEIDLKAVALKYDLNERTLQRLFQQELQTTPKQFLIKLRVIEAQRLLKETRLSVTDVAFEAGFGSFSSFLTAFRSHTGQTPLDYRHANSVR